MATGNRIVGECGGAAHPSSDRFAATFSLKGRRGAWGSVSAGAPRLKEPTSPLKGVGGALGLPQTQYKEIIHGLG